MELFDDRDISAVDENNPFSFKAFLQSSGEFKEQKLDIDDTLLIGAKSRKTLVIVDEDSSEDIGSKNIDSDSAEKCNVPQVCHVSIADQDLSQLPVLPEVLTKVDEDNSFVPETVIANLPDFCATETCGSKHIELQQEIDSLNNALEKHREDNFALREQLHSKNSRIEDLEEKVRKLKHREAEDLKSLEQMVQHVEQNLKLTTERALSAESTVIKLNQDIKVLQNQVTTLQKEKQQFHENVKLAAEELSSKINVAADGAESFLKSLLEGVEQLRTLSSIAASISRIQDTS